MGREYALASGESAEVAEAIGEHYRPRGAGDGIPQTQLGWLLSVCDKLDTICALFAVGVIPTGSADPYGLRREATGVVSVALALAPSVLLGPLVEVALGAVAEQVTLPRPAAQLATEVMGFVRQRVETYLREERGIRYDLVDAALSVGFDDVRAAAARAGAVQEVASDTDFLPTVMAATRVANIVKGFAGGEVRPELFQDPIEGALWSAYQEAGPKVEAQSRAGDCVGLFRTLTGLREPVDRYFEAVLVMAEEEAVRANRLATVSAANELFRRLGDFTLVVQA
jgi:glycyl-tRNA synthetase beta chain